MGELPSVSVIVPVYGMAKELELLLACLEAQTYPPAHFECLVVDNHPEPCLRLETVHPFSLRVLHEPRAGSYAARNRAVREASGSLLAFTDADCRPRQDWLREGVRAWLECGGEGVLGGRVQIEPGLGNRPSGWEWYSRANDLHQERYISRYGFAATANLLVGRELFERVGAFDGSLFSGGDWEWGTRAVGMGIPLLYAEAVVVGHPARTRAAESIRRARRVLGGHYRLALRKGRPFRRTFAWNLRLARYSLDRNLRHPLYPTLSIRAQAVAIDLLLRLVMVLELVRLSLGGLPLQA